MLRFMAYSAPSAASAPPPQTSAAGLVPPADGGAQRFALEVQPGSLAHPWHARLINPDGSAHEFEAPIELLRYLAALDTRPGPPAGLK
jgi:hypothetical protein